MYECMVVHLSLSLCDDVFACWTLSCFGVHAPRPLLPGNPVVHTPGR